MIEKYIILSLLYLEWITQKLLCLPYHLSVKVDQWNFNRNLEQRNIELAKQSPIPKND